MGLAKIASAATTGIASLALALAPGAAGNETSCASDPPPAPSPRIVRITVDGLHANVLLPAGYRAARRRYPVLYLLHGLDYNENTWLDQSDVKRFTAGFSGSRAAIVVMPDGGPGGWYTDWPDGAERWETYHLRHLLPAVDARFRTRPSRRYRAVAGFSMGGYGALLYAARHPDLFAVAGGFSPLSHITIPDKPYTGAPADHPRRGKGSPRRPYGGHHVRYRPPDDANSGCDNSSSQWGSGARDVRWHGLNPTDLASNLRGLTVYVASGNGAPCGPQDPIDRPTLFGPGDAASLLMTRNYFVPAARSGGARVHDDFYGCGVHTMRYAERDLHAFWGPMTRAFGARLPAKLRYRAIDRDFAVRGWTFHADPRRAAEFLEVRGADRRGLTLTGSGTETVVTPRIFRPHQRVVVHGARATSRRAGPRGRLTLTVDLGAPHKKEQFSGSERSNFVTRAVRFLRPRRR